MLTVSRSIEVNTGEKPDLDRDQLWQGLVLKAENALPFVAAMSSCEVVDRSDNALVRNIVFKGESLTERVTFTPRTLVLFERLTGRAHGTIRNEIEGGGPADLGLRFTFSFRIDGIAEDSPEEQEFADNMEGDYLSAVRATIDATRRLAREGRLNERTG